MKQMILPLLPVLAVLAPLLVASPPPVQADSPAIISIAIPHNVRILLGGEVVFTGGPGSLSPVNCASGTAQPQAVVVFFIPSTVSPSTPAPQTTGVLAFHDHEIEPGSIYRITGGPDACNSELRLWQAQEIIHD